MAEPYLITKINVTSLPDCRCKSMLVLIFLLCSHPTPDMTLGFVQIQTTLVWAARAGLMEISLSVQSLCTVLLLIPKRFAVCRTVAL